MSPLSFYVGRVFTARKKYIKSAAGTQQGDPLGHFLFCLIQQIFLRKIPESFEITYKKFFIDDGNLILSFILVNKFKLSGTEWETRLMAIENEIYLYRV
jgi:hypothetical protein